MIHLPNDCVLLLTAPLTKEAFFADLTDPGKDFVKLWAENQQMAAPVVLDEEQLWSAYHSRVVDFIHRKIDELQGLGMEVVPHARAQDFATAFSNKSVVTLDAHWFSPMLVMEDFIDPWGFLEELRCSKTPLGKAMSSRFGSEIGLLQVAKGEEFDAAFSAFIRRLNSAFSESDEGKLVSTLPGGDDIWIRLSRFEMESTFANTLRDRCRLEFFDGFCPPRLAVSTIPPTFDGVIDFTVCNSEWIGKLVKEFVPDCLVITNRFVTDLMLRLIILKGVIRKLAFGDSNYIDAMMCLRTKLLELNRR